MSEPECIRRKHNAGGAPKPATAEPVGVSKPATGSGVPAGKINALVGFETGSWPKRLAFGDEMRSAEP